MDGRSWTTVSVPAEHPYKTALGIDFTPALQVRCELVGKKKKATVTIMFVTGGAQLTHLQNTGAAIGALLGAVSGAPPASQSTDGPQWFRMKVGAAKPTERAWNGPQPDGSTFIYEGAGLNDGWGSGPYFPPKFLKDMFSAKTVMIEFKPIGVNDTLVVEFNVNDLRQEFDMHTDCVAPK